MNSIRAVSGIWVVVAVLWGSGGVEAKGARARKSSARSRTVTVPGAKLEQSTRVIYKSMPKPESFDSGLEIKAMLGATATLVLERSISYRRRTLPAGTYELRVERRAEASYRFVIRSKPAVDAKKRPSRKKKKRKSGTTDEPTMGLAGTLEEAEKAVESIHALFRLTRNTRPTRNVEFELALRSAGKKLEIGVRAGATYGRARLQLGAAKTTTKSKSASKGSRRRGKE